ncbi:hypothetical protein [Planococcus dechangensis]|uniref:Uncharacterized protein n=1 Tax=Planococcus dechangensis TaxID=1176255 RepID=A0ABV9MC93_9BACL
MKDGYQIFFDNFGISSKEIIDFGLKEAIFIPEENVRTEWENLKTKIYEGSSMVTIRGYGSGGRSTHLYMDLYENVFGHGNFKKDPTNNAEPKKIIQKLTGYRIGRDLQNYQVSHVFGRTKNPFAFSAPWNMVFLPKIVDPFTGHESKGALTVDFQKAFQEYTYSKYATYIEEFNQIVKGVHPLILDHLIDIENTQFTNDVSMQYEPIILGEAKEVSYKMD